MTLYGDWQKLSRLFDKKTLSRCREVALKSTLAYFQGQIKRNILSSGSLAGKPFEPNTEYTIKKKGSSKPLIDQADMVGAVTPVYIKETEGFVGLIRGARHITGKEVADIGWINEKGAVTEWGQVIPERPFVYPVLEKFEKEGTELYNKTFTKELVK